MCAFKLTTAQRVRSSTKTRVSASASTFMTARRVKFSMTTHASASARRFLTAQKVRSSTTTHASASARTLSTAQKVRSSMTTHVSASARRFSTAQENSNLMTTHASVCVAPIRSAHVVITSVPPSVNVSLSLPSNLQPVPRALHQSVIHFRSSIVAPVPVNALQSL